MTAQTAIATTHSAHSSSREVWWVLAWLVRSVAEVLARLGLAFALVVVGGIIAPLLAAQLPPAAPTTDAAASMLSAAKHPSCQGASIGSRDRSR
ncbi:MAG: hypothetical protein AB7L90_23105 [Hyphomicrobiaceae bacterium]